MVWEILEYLGKFKWGCGIGVYRVYYKGWEIIEIEVEEIGGEFILTGFVFYVKDFYILYFLFKYK